jgi:hypothetical protein
VTRPVIYHGTPLTPRAALLEVCKGRAMCVSFYRPDDVEAVEAISPDIMFRQRRVFNVEGSTTARRGVGRALGLVGLFCMARASLVSTGALGSSARYTRRAKSAQRCVTRPMAVWPKQGFSPVAHGRADRTPAAPVRALRPSVPWLDGRGQAFGSARISRTDARGRSGLGQSLACPAHDARDQGCMGLSVCQRRRNNTGAERMAL